LTRARSHMRGSARIPLPARPPFSRSRCGRASRAVAQGFRNDIELLASRDVSVHAVLPPGPFAAALPAPLELLQATLVEKVRTKTVPHPRPEKTFAPSHPAPLGGPCC